MDTNQNSQKLQKATVLIRNKEELHGYDEKFKDQLILVGGVMDGNISSTAGTGDSGGPLICRDKNSEG